MSENLQVRSECSSCEKSKKQEIKLLVPCFHFLVLCCSLALLFFPPGFLIPLMAFIFQNAFFLLADTSSECDCTSRNLLLVIKFFTLFREQMESMLVKTLFLDEGVSLPIYPSEHFHPQLHFCL